MAASFHKLHTRNSDETFSLGERLGRKLRGGEVIVLSGELGSGKTCFAQGVGVGLQVDEPLVSPTFPLLLQYQGRLPLVHMDLYRLSGIEEFILLDGEALMHDSRVVCLIEWGERVEPLLPDWCARVMIESRGEDRVITVRGAELE